MDGWPLIFYIYGMLGIMCTILWSLFATNKPEECKFMGEKEKHYLNYHLAFASSISGHGMKRRLNVPWKKLLTSLPVWSCMLTRFSFAWSLIVMQMLLPSYLRDVLYLDMSNNGLFTAMPFVVQLISKNIVAISSDYLKRSGKLGMTASTKLVQTFADVQPWSKFSNANIYTSKIHVETINAKIEEKNEVTK
uniref:Uncharacterized protein n=1 Tax=Acrobeloides nanus TaxID=290746 RepID=A0A914DB40_9BILA